MPDPIWKHFGYGQHAAGTGQGCICWIWFPTSDSVPFFQKRLGSYCTKPARIRPGWPGPVLVKCVWSGTWESMLACMKIIGVQFWLNTNSQLPVFHFQTQLHSSTDCWDHKFVQNPSGSSLVLADCQVWAKWIQSGSKPVCKNHQAHFWPPLLSWSRLDVNQIRHAYWVILRWYDF